MPSLTGEPPVLHDEGAEFIAYQWHGQCPDEIREYDFGDPVFPSEAEFAESLAEYVVTHWPGIRPGTEDFERVKGFARGECKIKAPVMARYRQIDHRLAQHIGTERYVSLDDSLADQPPNVLTMLVPRTAASIERVLTGQNAFADFMNTPAMLELAPPRKTDRWTTSMVRNNVERGGLPVASGGHRSWRCTTTVLIDWFTDRNIRHVDELARLDPALREHIVEKREHAQKVRYAQKVRDNSMNNTGKGSR
jgi:hypothetical protein